MTRREKKTRMRLLPPKVQLREADSYAGMVPGNIPGILPGFAPPTFNATIAARLITSSYRSYFSDTDTIVFARQTLEPGIGVLSGSSWISSSNQIITGGFAVPGNAIKGIADGLAYERRTEISDFRPFFDLANPAADGKSSAANFYASGNLSITGEELTQPVWSKQKIEIDLTQDEGSTFTFAIANTPGAPSGDPAKTMAFWNNASRAWNVNTTGDGDWASAGSGATAFSSLEMWLETGKVGFGGSAIPAVGLANLDYVPLASTALLGRPITNFGFPDHNKFALGTPTSPNIRASIGLSDYISRPFLAEKIVLYFSGSVSFGNNWFSGQFAVANKAWYAAWTFFVLNERSIPGKMRQHPVNTFTATTDPLQGTTRLTGSLEKSFSVRDLVTWMQITHVPSVALDPSIDDEPMKREYWFSTDPTSSAPTTFSGQIELSGVVKTPVPFSGLTQLLQETAFGTPGDAARKGQFVESWTSTGRRIGSDLGERSWNNPILQPEFSGKQAQNLGWTNNSGTGPGQFLYKLARKYEQESPYLLFPTDRLVLGWQLPVPTGFAWNSGSFNQSPGYIPVNGIDGPKMSISHHGIHKLVIYGSFIEEGKESTEIQDVDPTCISVRRVIGE